jgi:aryl-alcohol dehydrogenase-like predicted oxidoreductase
MHYRELGRTGCRVSDVSFGALAIGGAWGDVDDSESLAALNKAVDCGVNFIDTADVYGGGRSERLIAKLKRDRKEEIVVATKAGRRLSPHTVAGYNQSNATALLLRVRCIGGRRARAPDRITNDHLDLQKGAVNTLP